MIRTRLLSCCSVSPLLLLVLLLPSCRKNVPVIDSGKPQRILKEYLDKKYLLYRLSNDYYQNTKPDQSFQNITGKVIEEFKPLGYDAGFNLQYTHIYSKNCVYHSAQSAWKFAEVYFPNSCLTRDKAYAEIKVKNSSPVTKTYFVRLFYQNTTYWFPTNDSIRFMGQPYLDNYYGVSGVVSVSLNANADTLVKIPFTIGLNPKNEFDYDPSKDPARPGNYEFMALALPVKDDPLLAENLDLKKVNPFAEVKKDELLNGGNSYFNYLSYVGAHHFKFVFLDEYFDGANDLTADHIYLPKNGKEKRLCDTCSNWYKGVISEIWNTRDFFEGFIKKSYTVKADYGIKKENFRIDTNGITLTIPGSRRGDYKKSWGEFLFGPSFKYGHLTVRAKLAPMMTKTGTPNGIIHNLWLYQRDPDVVDTLNPFHYLRNPNGVQPYEIDFEVWSSVSNKDGTLWNDRSLINYGIVDYMRNPKVNLKPNSQIKTDRYIVERHNPIQASVSGEEFSPDFFNSFHTFELYWYPDRVKYLVDGAEKALITNEMAKIPDKYLFLWIGSPLYQDGTYYAQSYIPFLKYDKHTLVDYIRIE